jgi:DNA-binding GntR family transcriptional regulator
VTAVERPNLKAEVMAYIRRAVLSGELPPGSKIKQDEIASHLGVSKLPVREALIALEAEGVVDNRARRGAFVAQLTEQDVREHFAIYGALAALATERAATTLGDADLDRLGSLTEQMSQARTIRSWQPLNDAFHHTVNEAGASRRLLSLLGQLARTIPIEFAGRGGVPDWTYQDHVAIVDALRSGDAARAGRLMREHLERGADEAVAALHAAGFWPAGNGAVSGPLPHLLRPSDQSNDRSSQSDDGSRTQLA